MTNNAIHEVYPYLRVNNAKEAIAFYKAVFGAKEGLCLKDPSGRLGHVELEVGPVVIMMSDAFPEYGINAPDPEAGLGASIHLHVDDADALIDLAREHGAVVIREPADQFYGERSGAFRDPFGHEWLI